VGGRKKLKWEGEEREGKLGRGRERTEDKRREKKKKKKVKCRHGKQELWEMNNNRNKYLKTIIKKINDNKYWWGYGGRPLH
jgi:hypothetical protein